MRVVEVPEGGGLRAGERPEPEPAVGQVRVRVAACGVNHLDRMIAEGTLPGPAPRPRVPGGEVAGWVDAVGGGVDAALVGRAVAVAPYLFCGRCEMCLGGRETICRSGDILGLGCDGGYAEAVVVPAQNLVPLPAGLDPQVAAALPLAAATAHHMLVDRAGLRPGESVLVVGVGGGVASAGLRLARLMGARVIAASRAPDKLARAQADGAEATVTLGDPDSSVARQVRALTGGAGVDVVFDPLGSVYWADDLQALARGGRLVTCGAYGERAATTDVWLTFAKELSLLGSYGASRRNVAELVALTAAGAFTPAIAGRLPLAEAAEAHRRLRAGEVYGKLLLTP